MTELRLLRGHKPLGTSRTPTPRTIPCHGPHWPSCIGTENGGRPLLLLCSPWSHYLCSDRTEAETLEQLQSSGIYRTSALPSSGNLRTTESWKSLSLDPARRDLQGWAKERPSRGSPEGLRACTGGWGGSDAGLQPRYAVTSVASSPEAQITSHPLLRGVAPAHSCLFLLYTSSTLRSCFP